jgi:hypothetical protein
MIRTRTRYRARCSGREHRERVISGVRIGRSAVPIGRRSSGFGGVDFGRPSAATRAGPRSPLVLVGQACGGGFGCCAECGGLLVFGSRFDRRVVAVVVAVTALIGPIVVRSFPGAEAVGPVVPADPVALCTRPAAGTIVGTAGADVLRGTAGADVMCGFGGNDTITGLGGDDVIVGGLGDDQIDGGNGNDVLYGNAGRDTIVETNGADVSTRVRAMMWCATRMATTGSRPVMVTIR